MLLHLLRFAGIMHLGILTASALVPKVLDWKAELRPLKPLVRSMFWIYGGYIVYCIIGFGLLCSVRPDLLLEQSTLARLVAGFIGVFWGARLALQLFVIDARPFLTAPGLRLGYHGLTVCFTYLTAVLLYTAFR
jgi:hypothetical protein